ncbi:hypothetical protein RclHR1_11150004 [Rhizophagus clarus]|uniref:F-box domain-containing protein n=1 Tax=Rhizophagus clarus TaxID=94130 RepID=A0A2Z6QFQ9_9GLOM|nr:hypothetical protein RclHR1_11150004 [Rhizophagus clarus]GES92688.1 hypothetical protein GLOIN_2v866766 [Rhizophagus clarus]
MPYCYCFNVIVKLFKNQSTTPVPTLPTECMERIFLHVGLKEELFSCLLVNKYWCKNVLPLLWANPFEGLETSKMNNFKLIRMYLACLDNKELNSLNSCLKSFNISLSISSKPLYDYTSFLEEFSYKKLELAVSFFLHEWHNRDYNIDYKEEIVFYLSSSIFKLFMSQAINLKSFKIDQHFRRLDIPNISTFSTIIQPVITLSKISKFQLDYEKPVSNNLNNFLEILPKYSTDIKSLDFKITSFEYKFDIIKLIGNIIKSQNCLENFSLIGVQNCVEDLMPALHSKSDTLINVKFKNVHFTEHSLSLLSNFKNLKHFEIWYCDGLSSNSCKILLSGDFPNLKRLHLGCSENQDLITAFLDKVGPSLIQLGLNIITDGTIKAILNNCIILKDLQIIDYHPMDHPGFSKLFQGLKGLENLRIKISPDHKHYENMISWAHINAHILPLSLKYLKLECGLPINQLEKFLEPRNTEVIPNLSTLIINDLNFNYSHMKVISEFAKKKGTLKILGIGGSKNFGWKISREIKTLRQKYRVHIIPKNELNQW